MMLTSVWEGKDNELIPELILLHAASDKVIVDANHAKGRMWKGTEYNVIGIDVLLGMAAKIQADNTWLPIKSSVVDVLVYDPPHIADLGKKRVKKGLEYYGTVWGANNVSGLFPPFLSEANRVLKKNGILIAKIADQIQGGRHQWQLYDLITECRSASLTPCDLVVKIRKHPGPQPWDTQRHSRQRHSYFLVARKGGC